MKVNCDRQTLSDHLGLVSSVTNARSPKPALSCVRFSAVPGALTLTASDGEIWAVLTTNRVEVETPGEALLPADKVQQIVRESADATLMIEAKAEEAVIHGKDSTFRLLGYPVADFPASPASKEAGDADFEIEAGALCRLVTSTIFATAKDNSRYAIAGVLIEREGKNLVVVATDGHRLALSRGHCVKAEGGAKQSAIVPTKTLNLMLKVFTDPDALVRVKMAGNQVSFSDDHATLTSNLIEGNFPPYKDVVPKDSDKKAVLPREGFKSAVRRAAVLTTEESRGLKMSFTAKELVLSSRAPETGEAEVRLAVPEYTGEPVTVGFSPVYLLDALKVVEAETFTLEMRSPSRPGVIRTGDDFLYVVMPVNLQ